LILQAYEKRGQTAAGVEGEDGKTATPPSADFGPRGRGARGRGVGARVAQFRRQWSRADFEPRRDVLMNHNPCGLSTEPAAEAIRT
jgi:hypothetical protein